MSEEFKACRDCIHAYRHFTDSDHYIYVCDLGNKFGVDAYSGGRVIVGCIKIDDARAIYGICGPTARLFEPKPPRKPWYRRLLGR